MGAEHQKEENIESNNIEAAITAILGPDRRWTIIYEGIEHRGSIILGHREASIKEMISALEYATHLLKYGRPYLSKEGEIRIADSNRN